eukprot:gene27080-32719_t
MAFRSGFSSVVRLAQRSTVSNRFFSASKDSLPIGVLVTVEIQPDRVKEFLQVMKVDAEDSVGKENGGCLKFDVVVHDDNPNKFSFYEVYKNEAAIAFHKTTPHYNQWVAFKNSGGVVSQTAQKVRLAISHTSPHWTKEIAGQGVV